MTNALSMQSLSREDPWYDEGIKDPVCLYSGRGVIIQVGEVCESGGIFMQSTLQLSPPPAGTWIGSGLLAARLLRSATQLLRVLHRMGQGMRVRWDFVSKSVFEEITSL